MPTDGPLMRRLRPDDLEPAPGAAFDPEVTDAVRAIVERVRTEGDAALVEFTRRFDGADLSDGVAVPPEEFEAAAGELPAPLRGALDAMRARLKDLHERQVPGEWWDDRDGVWFGETVRPVGAAGAYVPGGRAAYPSTVLMTAVPAAVAGVGRVVLCTPPAADGTVPAAVRYAAAIAGVDAVYRIGGAQAVAAMAFGTESVPAVDVIVGPGNTWVTAAKREVSGAVGIDGLAGPTELVVVADSTADPAVLSADLVAQAEHDPLARVVLVTLDPGLPDRVEPALLAEVGSSPRREIVESSLRGSVAVVVGDEDEAARVADRVAPEHLQIVTADPRATLGRCSSYGAAFLGPLTPVAFGDYGVGSNHVLPTMATARFGSGLRAADFVRVSSVVEATAAGLRAHADEVEAVATAEGLPGHARAVEIRRRLR